MSDDRQLTRQEWAECEKLIHDSEEQQALLDIAELLAVQTKKIEDQTIYIRVLEDLAVSREEKVKRLEGTLEQLEKEVMKLR